jgi:hypothetical protein
MWIAESLVLTEKSDMQAVFDHLLRRHENRSAGGGGGGGSGSMTHEDCGDGGGEGGDDSGRSPVYDAARGYLLANGMTSDELDLIRNNLMSDNLL